MVPHPDDEMTLNELFTAIEICAAPSWDIPEELIIGRDEWTAQIWRPIRVRAEQSALDELYADLGRDCGPFRFPPLYERMILNIRWAQVDLEEFRLLANPPGPGLMALADELRKDEGLWEVLSPHGYIRFGMAPGGNYDPFCFDVRHPDSNGDCRVLQFDHEEILCYERIREVREVAPNFRSLVSDTIRKVDPSSSGLRAD
ncbi:MAG: hypothetical protein KY468_01380 [Armatimonadetes bacterium]|nr:hypothetical protein [Armatimonadota bacterium]